MRKRKFYSQLFNRYILPEEKDFYSIVYAELLYRIQLLNEKHCHCFTCNEELRKYEKSLEKIKKLRITQ